MAFRREFIAIQTSYIDEGNEQKLWLDNPSMYYCKISINTRQLAGPHSTSKTPKALLNVAYSVFKNPVCIIYPSKRNCLRNRFHFAKTQKFNRL